MVLNIFVVIVMRLYLYYVYMIVITQDMCMCTHIIQEHLVVDASIPECAYEWSLMFIIIVMCIYLYYDYVCPPIIVSVVYVH